MAAKPTKPLTDSGGNAKILKRSPSQGLTEIARANANRIMNEAQTKITNDAKSGAAAERGASMVRTGKPNETIKIRTSGLQGKSGQLGGQHMGGHGGQNVSGPSQSVRLGVGIGGGTLKEMR